MKKWCILWLCVLIIAPYSALSAQEKKTKKAQRKEQMEKVQNMVDLQNYKFVAQYALPMSGRSIILSADYDVVVGNDSINAYLPYFGRAYVAPADPTEGGIKFNSTDFDYRLEKGKKGGWMAHIDIHDGKQRIRMTLNITTTGIAHLSVNDDYRQTISFSGYVEERKR